MASSRFFALIPSYDIDPSVAPPYARGTAWAYESYCRQAVLVPMRRQSGRWVRLGQVRALTTLEARGTSHYTAPLEVNFGDEPQGTELVAVFFVVHVTPPIADHPLPVSDEVEQLIDALLSGAQPQLCGPSASQP